MKTLLIIAGLLVGTGLQQSSYAQVNVNINIGSQPLWGPTGYDYVDYYYLPDLDIYYYVPLQQWVYFDGRRWVTTTVLPPRYSNYDLYRLHKVVINEKQPYLRNSFYHNKYASFRGKYDQQPIRDSRDSRYYVIANHPMHGKAPANQGPNHRPQGNSRQQANKGHQGNGRGQGAQRGPH